VAGIPHTMVSPTTSEQAIAVTSYPARADTGIVHVFGVQVAAPLATEDPVYPVMHSHNYPVVGAEVSRQLAPTPHVGSVAHPSVSVQPVNSRSAPSIGHAYTTVPE
jgi:hypothetical protein